MIISVVNCDNIICKSCKRFCAIFVAAKEAETVLNPINVAYALGKKQTSEYNISQRHKNNRRRSSPKSGNNSGALRQSLYHRCDELRVDFSFWNKSQRKLIWL